MKKYIPILISLLFAIGLGFYFNNKNFSYTLDAQINGNSQVLSQKIIKVNDTSKQISKLYDSGKLVGVISDNEFIDGKLEEIYKERYQEKYPNASIDIGQDVYIINELSYYDFENIDDEIFKYLQERNLFTISANAIEFSNNEGVYDIIYVSDKSIFDDALNDYLKYFVDENSLKLIRNNQVTGAISGFGSRVTGIEIVQSISNKKAYTNPDNIKTTKEEVLEYLKYGKNTERKYYTVIKYDTVEGVGSKNFGLSATQVMNINSDIIKSTEQVLEAGTVLNVTYFTSPLDIIVNRESVVEENVYPDSAILVEDASMKKGEQQSIQAEVFGSKNVLYNEKWINGVLVSGSEISSVITKQPVQEIIKVGTLEIPGEGTGTFRWPVDNPFISCRWGCYYNHRAIDIQNSYNRYGELYASDRGRVFEVGYTSINGNYIIIDHGNGFQTYYGHMNKPTFLKIGDIVDKGDVIGQIGMTGKASGPHVHFFIMENGERRNPCEGYLPC